MLHFPKYANRLLHWNRISSSESSEDGWELTSREEIIVLHMHRELSIGICNHQLYLGIKTVKSFDHFRGRRLYFTPEETDWEAPVCVLGCPHSFTKCQIVLLKLNSNSLGKACTGSQTSLAHLQHTTFRFKINKFSGPSETNLRQCLMFWGLI